MLAPNDVIGLYNLACTFALLGERERAPDFLERSFTTMRPQFVVWAKNDSDLDSVRDHPRYQELIQHMEAKLAEADSKSTSETGAQLSIV